MWTHLSVEFLVAFFPTLLSSLRFLLYLGHLSFEFHSFNGQSGYIEPIRAEQRADQSRTKSRSEPSKEPIGVSPITTHNGYN
jgi:hypothetical protein